MSAVNVIAEVGMNHDGSLGNAIRMAEVAAESGADAVKFQLHDARGGDDAGRAFAALLRARDALGVLRADGVHRRAVGAR